jgi:hypothetical protein
LSFTNYTGNIPSILNLKNNTNEDSAYISINNELKPALVRKFEAYIKELNANQPSSPIFIRNVIPGSFCPIWARSHLILPTNLGIIGNVFDYLVTNNGRLDTLRLIYSTPLTIGLIVSIRKSISPINTLVYITRIGIKL